jgi:hypothetical protein
MGNAERNGLYYTGIQLVSKNILPFQRLPPGRRHGHRAGALREIGTLFYLTMKENYFIMNEL